MSSDRSPCLDCERAEKDKSRCAKICDRLQAWRDLDPMWEDVEIPSAEELGESSGSRVQSSESKTQNPKPGTRNQKSGGDMKSEKMCKAKGCTNPAKVRGVCLSCYKKWRDGKLDGFPPFTVVGKKTSAGMKKARATKRQGSEVGSQRSEISPARTGSNMSSAWSFEIMEIDSTLALAEQQVNEVLAAQIPVARQLMIQAFIRGLQCRDEEMKGENRRL